MALETALYRVKIAFPCSMQKVGEKIRVYKDTGMAYVAEINDYSEKVDVRDYPEIYELVTESDNPIKRKLGIKP